MIYDEEKVTIVESLHGAELWVHTSSGDEEPEGTVYLNRVGPTGSTSWETFSPAEALALAAELTRAAGGDPEPHVWEVYVNIVNDRKQSKFYKQISLHATKAGAEQKVEAEKKAWPEETSDPNFILAARKLRIGA